MTVFVTGAPRSGSSMMMRMLEAAGLRTAGQFPDYETPRWLPGEHDLSLLEEVDAVKWLSPHIRPPRSLPGDDNFGIVMTRDVKVQAASWARMREALGLEGASRVSRNRRRGFARQIERAGPKMARFLFMHGMEPIVVRFEDVINEPELAAKGIVDLVGQGDVAKVAAAVIDRGPGLAPELLERAVRL